MIKTFKIFLESLKDDYWNFVFQLNEEFKYQFYIKDNKQKIKINSEWNNIFNEAESKVYTYLTEINPFLGNSINFEIEMTEHWITKLFRKDFEDTDNKRGFINPNLKEGINLLKNNSKIIENNIKNGFIKDGDFIIIKTKDNSLYTEVVFFEKNDKNHYSIYLISQAKGNLSLDKGYNDKIIRLHLNGPLTA